MANLADASGAELASNTAALLVGASTFVPSTLRRRRRGKIGVGTLMTIAAVIPGQGGEAAMLAFLYSISEGLDSRTPIHRGLPDERVRWNCRSSI